MRLVTRPDLDGLTCAVLLSRCETIDAVELVHPQDVTDRRVTIGPADVLGLTLDPRTGLGGPRDYFDLLLRAVRERPLEEVLALPEVRERAARMRQQDQAFREAALAHSTVDANVLLTDYRSLDVIPVGNRFLVFTLFPQANVAVRVQWGPGRQNVAVSAGRSIFNHTSRANLGVLMSLYGGGGHAGAGACTLPPEAADARIAEIVSTLKRNG